jgi:hypothetical protein
MEEDTSNEFRDEGDEMLRIMPNTRSWKMEGRVQMIAEKIGVKREFSRPPRM